MLNCQYIGHNQAKSLEAYEVWKESILLLAEFFILTVLSFCSKMVAWLHLSLHNIDCLLFEYFMENLYLSITNHLLLFFLHILVWILLAQHYAYSVFTCSLRTHNQAVPASLDFLGEVTAFL
jgi:hypothetical protein